LEKKIKVNLLLFSFLLDFLQFGDKILVLNEYLTKVTYITLLLQRSYNTYYITAIDSDWINISETIVTGKSELISLCSSATLAVNNYESPLLIH
jgi:hypothetical protein